MPEEITMYCSGEGGAVKGRFVLDPRYGWVHMTKPPHTVMGSPLGGERATQVPMIVLPLNRANDE